MSFEDRFTTRLRDAGDQMPVGALDVESIVSGGRRSLRFHRFALIAATVTLAAGGFILVEQVLFDDRVGEILPADEQPSDGWDVRDHYDEIREESLRFSRVVDSGDAAAAWDMLTSRARQASGGFASWEREFANVRALHGWIHDSEASLYLTPLVTSKTGAVVTVTAAAPVTEDGSGLLETFPVRVVGDEVRIDVDSETRLSLVPEVPLFVSGCAGAGVGGEEQERDLGGEGCENPADFRPTISDGMTFSALIGPANELSRVVFAVGGDEVLLLAGRTPAEDNTARARATFPGADASRETVFTVVISTLDGEVESYGYRVLYEDAP